MSDQKIKRWPQQKASNLRYTFDFAPFATAHSLVVDTVTGKSQCTSRATLSNEAVSDSKWTGEVNAVAEGESMISLTATFTNSSIKRVRKFLIDVTDQ